MQILQFLNSNRDVAKTTNDLETLSAYKHHLHQIEKLLSQLEHETTDFEKLIHYFQSSQNESRASFQSNRRFSGIEILFSALKQSQSCKNILSIKSNKFEMDEENYCDFKFPCKITSCICGEKTEKKTFQKSKISQIFSKHKFKKQISKMSINSERLKKSLRSENSSKSDIKSTLSSFCQCTESLNNTPINIQLSMDVCGESNSPLTFVIEVPSSVLDHFQRRCSEINNSVHLSPVKKSKIPKPKRKNHLISVFSNLLNNKKQKSCTSVSTLKSSSFETPEIFSSGIEISENQFKDLDLCNSFPTLSEFSQINIAHRTSEELNPELCNSDVENLNTACIIDNKIYDIEAQSKMKDSEETKSILVELCKKVTNSLENQFERIYDNKLNAEKKKMYCLKCKQNLEFFIDIKIIKYPLHLKKTKYMHTNCLDSQNRNELLERLIGALPNDNLNNGLVNERRFGSKSTFWTNIKSSVTETSVPEYLLQNIVTNKVLREAAEKDWHQVCNKIFFKRLYLAVNPHI